MPNPSRQREQVAARYLPSARETFAALTGAHDAIIRRTKLTKPQRAALDAIAGSASTKGAPIHRASVVTDAMFAKLEAAGLVIADTTKRPHRARLTALGMAYTRRADALKAQR